jgi:peptide chain release factor 2
VSRDRSRLESQINTVREMEQGLEDGVMLADMADEEGDEATLEEARASLKAIKDRAARADL